MISKATAAISKTRWFVAGQIEGRDMKPADVKEFARELRRYADALYREADDDDDDDDSDIDLDDDE